VSLINKSSKEVNCAGSLHHKSQQVKRTKVKAFQTGKNAKVLRKSNIYFKLLLKQKNLGRCLNREDRDFRFVYCSLGNEAIS